jgi:S-adenosylmethionine hydrolase
LGEVITDPERIRLPQPEIQENEANGEVILLYTYLGNIITNIHRDDLPELKDLDKVKVEIGGQVIEGMNRTFGEREPGTLIALFGSTGLLMVSVVNGSAIELLNPKLGDKVRMVFG